MGDVIKQSTIWKFVGRVSAITGLVCFPHGSPYRMSLGKLGYGGHLVYLFVCSFMWCLMMRGKRIQVSEKFKGVVGAILFVVIGSISMVYDKYVPGKSDAYTITSYGSFALMSVSISKKLELGFETGFTNFFLQLFAAQLFKIKWFLLPIALVFCSLVIILRHYSEPRVEDIGSEESTHQRLIDESTMWNFVGGVSAINGLVCFPQGSTYHMSFGKLGYGGLLVYLLVCLFMWYLMVWAKRIPVPEKFRGFVGFMVFMVVMWSVIELHSKYDEPAGESYAYTITSYGSFALMFASLPREIMFGENAAGLMFLFFLDGLSEINQFLPRIAIVFWCLFLMFPVIVRITRYFPKMCRFLSEQSLLSTTNNQENNQEEPSSQAMDRSPSNVQLPEGISVLLDRGISKIGQQISDQGQVSLEPHRS